MNVVEIAGCLLAAGADVDAGAAVRGGTATSLLLVLTSPRLCGTDAQKDLADLFLARGAAIPPRVVRACLTQGCMEAAHHIAGHGAPLDLAEAAGLGWLPSVVQRFDGAASPSADMSHAALLLACRFDHRDVAAFLIGRGADVQAPAAEGGHTALHVAAYGGYPLLVELLLEHGAEPNSVDDVSGTTPIVWAMHAWLVENREPDEEYRAVITLLIGAGAHMRGDVPDHDRLRRHPHLFGLLVSRAKEWLGGA